VLFTFFYRLPFFPFYISLALVYFSLCFVLDSALVGKKFYSEKIEKKIEKKKK